MEAEGDAVVDDDQAHACELIVIGELEVDLAASRARLRGRTLPLRSREFELLAYLAARRGEFVSRADILRDVWDDEAETKHNTLHVHLATLRTKLGERARRPRLVTTRRRGGIRLDVPDSDDRPGRWADHQVGPSGHRPGDHGETEPHRRATLDRPPQVDPPTVGLDGSTHDVESEPRRAGPADPPGQDIAGPESSTGIGHLDDELSVAETLEPDPHRRALGRVSDRVGEQLVDDCRQIGASDRHERRVEPDLAIHVVVDEPEDPPLIVEQWPPELDPLGDDVA
jgi:DNA-binding winged helix-turn-helix (wHTH) protein